MKVDRGPEMAPGSDNKGTSSASDFRGELSLWGVVLAERRAEMEHQGVA